MRRATMLSLVTALWLNGVISRMDLSSQDDLSARVLKLDIDAIGAAGRSGDQRYAPALRYVLSEAGKASAPVRRAAQFALARLDDRDQLQRLWCEAMSEEPTNTDDRVRNL